LVLTHNLEYPTSIKQGIHNVPKLPLNRTPFLQNHDF
jgi:hypothetical protein